MFLQRTLSSFVFAPVVGLAFYAGGPYFIVIIALVSLFGAWEYRSLLERAGIVVHPSFIPAATVTAVSGCSGEPLTLFLATVVASLFLLGASVVKRNVPSGVYGVSGVLYLGCLLGALGLLRMGEGGREWAIFALITTWATDVGAYLGGSSFGRTKMAPDISPSKSWEGAGSGVLAAALAGWAMSGFTGIDLPVAICFGTLLGIFAEMGDLVESLFKRFCKAKDSGKVIPGHGGILDRFDSLLFTGSGTLLLRFIHTMLTRS